MSLEEDAKNYIQSFNSAIRGQLKEQSSLRVLSSMPSVYRICGIQDKPLILPCGIVKKANLTKHEVPLVVLEDLTRLLYDPMMILKSNTEKTSFVVVLDALDNRNNRIVSIIRDNGSNYNRIPSIYGKDHFDDFVYYNICDGNVLYYNKEKVVSAIRPSSLHLLGVYT